MFGWYPWTRIMPFEANIYSNYAPWVSRPPPGPVRNGHEACTSRAWNFYRQFGRYLELRLGILAAAMPGDAFCGAANARGRLFRTPHAS